MKKVTFETLDKTMLEWFTQQRALGNPVNGVICAEKAKIFLKFWVLKETLMRRLVGSIVSNKGTEFVN